MGAKQISQSNIKSLLNYDLGTGLFTRKVSAGSGASGCIAGTVNGRGYCQITINRKIYKAHRLAFLYVLGYIPEKVDHINHDTLDNRWINLRPADSQINGRNQSMHKTNTSGCCGVTKHKQSGRWQAQIKVVGKNLFLGLFDDLESAIAARKAANTRYNFHNNHGKQENNIV